MTKKEHKLIADTLNILYNQRLYYGLSHRESMNRVIEGLVQVLDGTQKNFDKQAFVGAALNPSSDKWI